MDLITRYLLIPNVGILHIFFASDVALQDTGRTALLDGAVLDNDEPLLELATSARVACRTTVTPRAACAHLRRRAAA